MCGISGFINFSKTFSKEELSLYASAMSDSMLHRGPNSNGIWVDEKEGVSFSHRRLSILDLSKNGYQPMESSCGRYLIVYNGEIYNFKELREIIEESKLKFKSSTDTEVIIELVSKFGVIETTKLLNGIFCFAIWDKKKTKLFIVRDRVGVKPVYIYKDHQTVAFASEIKALKKLPFIKLKIDYQSVSSYVRLNYIPSPYSIFKNVTKLSPGTIFEIGPNKKIKNTKYWQISNFETGKVRTSNKDSFSIIEEAVKSQMVSDVPLGVFLSGGIDSSLIASMAQKNSVKPINSFTIGFEDNQFNEAEYAKKIAKIIGTSHNEVYFSYNNLEKLLNVLPSAYDEPFADSSQLPTLLLSQITKKKVTVALSGDGGDELFAGYYRYFLAERYQKYIFRQPLLLKIILKKIINSIPKKMWDSLGSFLPNSYGGNQFGDKLLKLSNLLANPQETSFQRRIISNCNQLSLLVKNGSEKKVGYFDDEYEKLFPDITERMQVLDFLIYLPDDILTKVDRASMNHSLEVRVPFLDNNVIDHAFGLEKKYKIKNNEGKLILKKLLKNFLPSSLVNRPKMGFGIPLGNLLKKNFSEKIEHYIYSKNIENQNIYEISHIRRLWEEHKSGKRNWQFLLWNFFVFQMWYEYWESNS